MFTKLIARILARLISGVFIFLGTFGLMVVKDVFSNHAALIALSVIFLLVGVVIAWFSYRKWK